MIRAILFDKDGTFTDFRATWEGWLPGMIDALAREAEIDPEVIADILGFDRASGRLSPDGAFVTAPKMATAQALAAVTHWPRHRIFTWITERERQAEQVLVTPLAPYLSALRARGLRLGVLTNADRAEASHQLEASGALPLLDRLICCDDGFGAKPDPRGAADFADALGLARHEVVLVGDGRPDMAAAAGAGLRAVGVLTGTLSAADLAPPAEAVLPDITHLPGWLSSAG
ncbi:MAG: HAD family hydrolase [Pseudomonadota bacterium]